MIGLNTLAMPAVPRRWMTNSTIRISTAIGMTQSLEGRGGDLEALDRRQHRDRRSDQAVAVQQCCAEHAERDHAGRHPRHRLTLGRDHQRCQRQDAALTVVVGPHHRRQVLETDDDDQRPERHRRRAERRGSGDFEVGVVERLSKRVDAGWSRCRRKRCRACRTRAEPRPRTSLYGHSPGGDATSRAAQGCGQSQHTDRTIRGSLASNRPNRNRVNQLSCSDPRHRGHSDEHARGCLVRTRDVAYVPVCRIDDVPQKFASTFSRPT